MATKYENYASGDTESLGSYLNHIYAQTFTPQISHKISSVKLKVLRLGTIIDVTVEIYATSGGLPTGSVLCSATVDGSAWSTDTPAWVEWTFSVNPTLAAGTMYAIAIYENTGYNASNCPLWRADPSSPTYTRGTGAYDIGSGWVIYSAYDFMFEEYGDPTYIPVDKTFSKRLVCIAHNEVWYESPAGTMIELTDANGGIDVSQPLEVFEAYEKVFIVNGTNKKVADFGNVKLHTLDIVPAGKTYPRHGTLIEATGGADSGAKMIVDYITALDGDTYIYGKLITTETFLDTDVCTATITEGDVSFTLDAAQVVGPHWYGWTVYGNSSTYGTMPDQVNVGCLWRGRGCLSANKDYPHQWYQTRQENLWDFAYTANDAQTPVAGGGDPSIPGQIGDIVVVQIPYDRDHLIFGCANSIYCLFGDAAIGGVLDKLDIPGGILGTRAWCKDKDGNFYMLVSTGLIKIPKGFGSSENLTGISYPDFIKDLAFDPSNHRIVMGYDRLRHAVKIIKTTLADGTNSGWWYDLKTKGLFPESYPTVCGIFSMFNYEAIDPDYQKLLFGCNDGYVRFGDDDAVNDAASGDTLGSPSTAINSYITFGPIKLGGENQEGKITSLVGITTGGASGGSVSDSDDITFKVWANLSADRIVELLYANTGPNFAGTISAPGRIRGSKKRQGARGTYAGIRMGNNTADETWGLEKLLFNAKQIGKVK